MRLMRRDGPGHAPEESLQLRMVWQVHAPEGGPQWRMMRTRALKGA